MENYPTEEERPKKGKNKKKNKGSSSVSPPAQRKGVDQQLHHHHHHHHHEVISREQQQQHAVHILKSDASSTSHSVAQVCGFTSLNMNLSISSFRYVKIWIKIKTFWYVNTLVAIELLIRASRKLPCLNPLLISAPGITTHHWTILRFLNVFAYLHSIEFKPSSLCTIWRLRRWLGKQFAATYLRWLG